jgi:hypothetical protein
MAFIPSFNLAILISCAALWALSRFRRHKKSSLSLPPGPKGLPFLGNINDLPGSGVLEYHHWAKHKDLYGG